MNLKIEYKEIEFPLKKLFEKLFENNKKYHKIFREIFEKICLMFMLVYA